MDNSTSTPRSPRQRTSRTQSRGQRRQSQDDNDEEINEGPLGTYEVEPGFIAKATEHGQSFLTAYKILVKIYPDRKKNFDVNISKLLEVYLNSVLNNSQLEDPRALALLDFAKAGLVVQGSTSIYSKKVEFLVDLLTQLLGFVESGVASDEGAEGDVQPQSSRRAAAVKDNSFNEINIELHGSKCKLNLDRRGIEKKLNYRPMCFPILMRQDQCDFDKQRITTLNPSFTGDKTTFRLWGPLSGQQGLLVSDLASIQFSISTNNADMSDVYDDIWDVEPLSDDGESRDTPLVDPLENCLQEHRDTHAATALPKPILADAPSEVREDENKENKNRGSPWENMELDDFVPNLELEPRIKSVVPRMPLIVEIQEALIKTLIEKTGRTKKCFGEAVNEAIELQESRKMLIDANMRKRKRGIATPNAGKTVDADLELFHENASDTEDVAAFTETGGVIYATMTIEEQILTEMAAPIIHADDWQAEDMDDAAMFLDPNVDLQQPGSSTNDIISEPPPSTEDDNDLAQRLEEWFKKINKLQEIESRKPQFTFHSYCKAVLQKFPPEEDRVSFKSFVEGLPVGQTARYLLATLQLANTKNVEIVGNLSGRVSNDSLEIILLNKSRVVPTFDEDEVGS